MGQFPKHILVLDQKRIYLEISTRKKKLDLGLHVWETVSLCIWLLEKISGHDCSVDYF